MRKSVQFLIVAGFSAVLLVIATGAFEPQGDQVQRGFFQIARRTAVISAVSNSDCLVYIWARNEGPENGGLRVTTPPSQYHTLAAPATPNDSMVFDLPGSSGTNLGCIGLKANEPVGIQLAYGSRLSVFVTVVSTGFATISMN